MVPLVGLRTLKDLAFVLLSQMIIFQCTSSNPLNVSLPLPLAAGCGAAYGSRVIFAGGFNGVPPNYTSYPMTLCLDVITPETIQLCNLSQLARARNDFATSLIGDTVRNFTLLCSPL